jgi:hypothetical protein
MHHRLSCLCVCDVQICGFECTVLPHARSAGACSRCGRPEGAGALCLCLCLCLHRYLHRYLHRFQHSASAEFAAADCISAVHSPAQRAALALQRLGAAHTQRAPNLVRCGRRLLRTAPVCGHVSSQTPKQPTNAVECGYRRVRAVCVCGLCVLWLCVECSLVWCGVVLWCMVQGLVRGFGGHAPARVDPPHRHRHRHRHRQLRRRRRRRRRRCRQWQ